MTGGLAEQELLERQGDAKSHTLEGPSSEYIVNPATLYEMMHL